MKILTVTMTLLVASLTIKWDQVDLSSDLRGVWNNN